MKPIRKVKDKPLDARCPNISLSSERYQKGLQKLRNQAKAEHRELLTDNGIEDYR